MMLKLLLVLTVVTGFTVGYPAEIPEGDTEWSHPDCVFPFTYNGVEYNGCTDFNNTRMWCSTTAVYIEGSYVDCTIQGEQCSADEFQCYNDSSCVPKSAVCNFDIDCSDKSDEAGCCYHDPSQFRCHSDSSCVSLDWKCDGEEDCPEESDEVNCGSSEGS